MPENGSTGGPAASGAAAGETATTESVATQPTRGRGLLAVFRGCRSSLTRLIGRIVNRHDVDDILQEAFMRSYEAAGKASIRNPRAFLLRTATNLALNHVSRASNKLNAQIEDLSLPEVYELTTESPESQLDANQRFVTFCRAVGGLPEQCRHAFILKKVFGLSQQEIADRLGIAQSTVEKHIAKGLTMCREYMETVNRPVPGSGGEPSARRNGQRNRT
jgi:RNA polymerase sigma factor (sigma-70 family)